MKINYCHQNVQSDLVIISLPRAWHDTTVTCTASNSQLAPAIAATATIRMYCEYCHHTHVPWVHTATILMVSTCGHIHFLATSKKIPVTHGEYLRPYSFPCYEQGNTCHSWWVPSTILISLLRARKYLSLMVSTCCHTHFLSTSKEVPVTNDEYLRPYSFPCHEQGSACHSWWALPPFPIGCFPNHLLSVIITSRTHRR